MNQLTTIPDYELAIEDSRKEFEELCAGMLSYGKEAVFAMQMLAKNEFSINTANRNPRSVLLAMINVASTGLTLNPAYGYAYLVPRDGAIMLDISYKGLIKIATDAGGIEWARAECVHENDKFTYRGPAAMPDIVADPFRERGPIIGAYCIAKTPKGDILTECMDMAAIEKVRSKSTAWVKGSAGRKGPWEDFPPEMFRKSVIKRARKTWPYTGEGSERLAKAIEIANQAEGGYEFDKPAAEARIAPMAGAWDAITAEERTELTKCAVLIGEYMQQDDAKGAYDYCERLGLSTELKMALWTQLDSKTRAALKKQGELMKALDQDRKDLDSVV
jgi:phage RecT family recombinase